MTWRSIQYWLLGLANKCGYHQFCDFCICQDCRDGHDAGWTLHHAQCSDGRWICEVCYQYDLCTEDEPNRNKSGPCTNLNCEHRPTIVGRWELAK